MKIHSRKRKDSKVYSSALNDILFILLLFFLIVSTLANPNVIRVNNPKGNGDSKVKQTIAVTIDDNQKIYVGTDPVTVDSLQVVLGRQLEGVDDSNRIIVINADKLATADNIIKVMKAANENDAKAVFTLEKE